MRSVFIGIWPGLACLFAAGEPMAAVGTSDPHALEVARELAAERSAAWSKLEPTIELTLRRVVVQALVATEPAKSGKIAAVVHDGVQALGDDIIEARAAALAGTYSSAELDGLLAFRRSDLGLAYSRASPELAREVAAALKSGASPAEEPSPPPEKLELVHRILTLEDADGRARKGWRTLHFAGAQAMSEARKAGPAPVMPATGDNQKAEDDYVHLMLTVEGGFLAKTFSTDQLSRLAAYYEGPIGRAAAEGAPELAKIAATEIQDAYNRRFAQIEQRACEAIACQPSQRRALELALDPFRAAMGAVAKEFAR